MLIFGMKKKKVGNAELVFHKIGAKRPIKRVDRKGDPRTEGVFEV